MIFAFLLCFQAGSAVTKLRILCHILSFYLKNQLWLSDLAAHSRERSFWRTGSGTKHCLDINRPQSFWDQRYWIGFCPVSDTTEPRPQSVPKTQAWGLSVWVNPACPCTGGNTAAFPLCPPPRELEENLGQSTENCITVLALIILFDSIKGNLQWGMRMELALSTSALTAGGPRAVLMK